MAKGIIFFFFFMPTLFSLLGCEKNDDNGGLGKDSFYRGAQQNADVSLLNKYWSVYEANFDGKTAPVENIYASCDRPFFTFLEDGIYKEFIVSDSGCIPSEQELQWSVANGVIKLENSFKDFSEMVILELSTAKFIFRVKYDFDDDGEEDVLQFYAKPYQPNEGNFYSNSIYHDEAVKDRFRFTWTEYNGINVFNRYEVYLSSENCDMSRATLVATIMDKESTFYEDLNPPVASQLCYFLRVYTDKGLLQVNHPASVSPEYTEIPAVQLNVPVVQNGKISLEWEAYQGLYFSHYELYVKNYLDGFGGNYQEELLTSISDINNTSYVDENPPILKNPVYEIKVVNKFGKQNYYNPFVVLTIREADYTSERVVDLKRIQHLAQSPAESIVYLNGEAEGAYNTRLYRYNYDANTVEAISNIETNGTFNSLIRVVGSEVGQEVMFMNYNGIMVFEPNTLQYKYLLNHPDFRNLQDFKQLSATRFLVVDDVYVYVVERDFANITILDKEEHSLSGFNAYQTTLKSLQIGNNGIILGHRELSFSTIFTIGDDGTLNNKTSSNIPITARRDGESVYLDNSNSIINFNENRIYQIDAGSFTSFEQPYFPKTMNTLQTKIVGTSNDPDWFVDQNSLHKREMTILDLGTGGLSTLPTEGYPDSIFENHLGQTVLLSTYYKRDKFSSVERPDFFFEVINP